MWYSLCLTANHEYLHLDLQHFLSVILSLPVLKEDNLSNDWGDSILQAGTGHEYLDLFDHQRWKAQFEEKLFVVFLSLYQSFYLLPEVLTEFDVSNIHQSVQVLSLISYPSFPLLQACSFFVLLNLEQKLQQTVESFVMEKVFFWNVAPHCVNQNFSKLFDVFNI